MVPCSAFNGVLRIDMPRGVVTVVYADDLAVLVPAATFEGLVAKSDAEVAGIV